MQNFIVLGQIPGTQTQLTFQLWLYIAIGFFSLLLVPSLFRLAWQIYRFIAIRQIARTIDSYELAAV